jgi:SAM-dependent methyltransferase
MPEPAIVSSILKNIDALGLPTTSRVLDLSCGEGEILQHLAERGYPVEGTHYCDNDYIIQHPSPILREATLHNPVDLTQPLPFEDESVDLVLATEVLEHLPSHAPLLQEIGRILKPGGFFLFSTPNCHRALSRLQFLFTGTHALNGARLGWQTPVDELYSTHFNPVYFPVIHGVLHQSGLRIQRLGFTSARLSGILASLLLWPLALLPTLLEARHFTKRSPEGGRDLLKWLLHPKLFLSKQIVVVATKE